MILEQVDIHLPKKRNRYLYHINKLTQHGSYT